MKRLKGTYHHNICFCNACSENDIINDVIIFGLNGKIFKFKLEVQKNAC